MQNAFRQSNAPLEPRGKLASRRVAMPCNTNPLGDIFGGWIMSLMDEAAAMTATEHAKGRAVTVGVSNIRFTQPINPGDIVCSYTDLVRAAGALMTLHVEVWVLRQGQGDRIKVTDAEFLFAAINEKGRPRPVSKHDQIATHGLDAATRGAHKNGKPQHTARASPHLNASLSATSWL